MNNRFMFKDTRDELMRKLRNNEPLDEHDLRMIEIALTIDCLHAEVLAQSMGMTENTFDLSTAETRHKTKKEGVI